MQSTFSSNILALNEGKPEQLNLKEILNACISFRKKIITKRTVYDLNKARDRAHILIGFEIYAIPIPALILSLDCHLEIPKYERKTFLLFNCIEKLLSENRNCSKQNNISIDFNFIFNI